MMRGGIKEEEEEEDEPMTPAGRFFMQPEMDHIINCAIGYKNQVNMDMLKSELKKSILLQHPRFQSLCVKDKHGVEHWRKIDGEVDIDKHVMEKHIISDDEDDEVVINRYLADLSVSTSLETDKPLWEVHVLREQRCFVLRIHHAFGDGVSLMSLFLLSCKRVDVPDQLPTIGSSSSAPKGRDGHFLWRLIMMVMLSLVYVLKFVTRSMWVKDSKLGLSGGPGVELWPRKVATAKFSLEDMKLVKKAVDNATINDVLFGVISSGLARYLDLQSSEKPRDGIQITGLAMVNLRPQRGLQELSDLMKKESKSRWGNQFGYVLLPIYLQKDVADPLLYVKRAKAMLDRKKLSLEAFFTYWIGYLVMSLLGPKVAVLLNYRVVCNTSFTMSNIVGPQEEIMFGGNPLTYIRVTSTSLSHAITMHMVSYAGKAEMQILVAKDIIPEPRLLAKCFEDALLEMKQVATTSTKIQEGIVSDGSLQNPC